MDRSQASVTLRTTDGYTTFPLSTIRGEFQWVKSGDRDGNFLGVRVTNGWTQPIPNFSLKIVYHYDAAQPMTVGDVKGQWTSGTMSMFNQIEGMRSNALYPSGTAGYVLDPVAMASYGNMAVSLSSDSHWVALCTDGYEFDRIPGSMVAEFLDTEPTE